MAPLVLVAYLSTKWHSFDWFKIGHQVAPLALFAKLANRLRKLPWIALLALTVSMELVSSSAIRLRAAAAEGGNSGAPELRSSFQWKDTNTRRMGGDGLTGVCGTGRTSPSRCTWRHESIEGRQCWTQAKVNLGRGSDACTTSRPEPNKIQLVNI